VIDVRYSARPPARHSEGDHDHDPRVTASQALVDRPSKDRRRGRAAAANLIPASTGPAKATTKALPEDDGNFDGVAIRALVPVGSTADIVCVVGRPTSVNEVNRVFRDEAGSARYGDIVGVSHEAIVSTDIIHDPRASIIDCTLTQVVDGDLVKVMSWYDNEWGYTAQLVREAKGRGRPIPVRIDLRPLREHTSAHTTG